MRAGLIALGVILLVFGSVFFFFPTTTAAATGTSVEDSATKTVIASAVLPPQLSLASIISGIILMILGIFVPDVPHIYVTEDVDEGDIVYEKHKVTTKH